MTTSFASEDKATVEETLRNLLHQEDSGGREECNGLLAVLTNHPELGAKVAEVIASFAREDAFRDVAVSCGVVPALCPLLASDDKTTQLHTLRAVGNLCFDHDGNREQMLNSGGCPLLIKQLTSCASLPADRDYDRLKCVSCGCLLNTVNNNEKLCEELLGLQVVRPLCTLMATPGENSDTITMGLKALFVLVAASSRQPTLLFPESLSSTFSYLLGRCVADGDLLDDITESLLETMEVAISANDDVSMSIVKAGCVEQLVQIVDPIKAIDLLVLICANDSCLKLLAEKTALLTAAEQWLTDSSSLKRQANTALLFANMARTDEMCDILIARGLVPQLIHLTQLEEPAELSGKVHISALSALRNLCLPATHKPLLVEKGVLKAALACLRESAWPHVHFKCLGIARLLITQQEEVCRQLVLSQLGTVALVCERCLSAEPAHVKIEGSRLLAAAVKYCNSNEVMRAVVSEGGVKLMASLLESEHVLLRNEVLISLNLLALLGEGQGGEEGYEAALTAEEVVHGVWGVVSNTDSSPELLTNALILLLQLTKPDGIRQKLCTLDGFIARMKALCQHNSEAVTDKAKQLTTQLSLEHT